MQRYKVVVNGPTLSHVELDARGPWVFWKDVRAMMAENQREINELKAMIRGYRLKIASAKDSLDEDA